MRDGDAQQVTINWMKACSATQAALTAIGDANEPQFHHSPRRSRAICGHHRGPRRRLTDCSKIRTHWKNGNNLRPSSPHLVVDKRPGTAPQFCGLRFMETRAIAVPIPNLRFRHSTIRRQGARRPPPREDPAQARHAPAGGFDNRTTGCSNRSRCSLQPGMTLSPSRFLDRKIAARLFRRCSRPVEARIMPDCYVSSMGSAFTEAG